MTTIHASPITTATINEFRDAVDSSKKEIVNSLDTDPKDNIDKDSEE